MFLFLIPFDQSDASDLSWDHLAGGPNPYVTVLLHKLLNSQGNTCLSDQILKVWLIPIILTVLKQNIGSHTSVFCIFMVIKERRNVEKHDKWNKVGTILLLPVSWLQSTVSTGDY